jgi:hypothetical protein
VLAKSFALAHGVWRLRHLAPDDQDVFGMLLYRDFSGARGGKGALLARKGYFRLP